MAHLGCCRRNLGPLRCMSHHPPAAVLPGAQDRRQDHDVRELRSDSLLQPSDQSRARIAPEGLSRLRRYLAAAAIAIYFCYAAWPGLLSGFSHDDLMNASFAFRDGWAKILGANVVFFSSYTRP